MSVLAIVAVSREHDMNLRVPQNAEDIVTGESTA
jgi:hypothetical protein